MGRSSRTGGLIRTKSGESSRNRESLPAAKNNTSKHEKQRRSTREIPNSTRRERSSPQTPIFQVPATSLSRHDVRGKRRAAKEKSRGFKPSKSRTAYENHTARTHELARTLTFPLHSRSPGGARAGASILLPVDPRSEQTGRRVRGSELGALWWWRLRFLSRSGSWTGSSGERKGGEGKEARQGKRGRNGC